MTCSLCWQRLRSCWRLKRGRLQYSSSGVVQFMLPFQTSACDVHVFLRFCLDRFMWQWILNIQSYLPERSPLKKLAFSGILAFRLSQCVFILHLTALMDPFEHVHPYISTQRKFKWSSATTRLTAHFTYFPMSDLVICKHKKSTGKVRHDTECPYWDKVSFNSLRCSIATPNPFVLTSKICLKQQHTNSNHSSFKSTTYSITSERHIYTVKSDENIAPVNNQCGLLR